MTGVPRGITARQLVKALREDGFELRRVRSSHHVYGHPDGRRVVVAYHHLGDTFPVRTLRSMLADAGWQEADLRRLGLLRSS